MSKPFVHLHVHSGFSWPFSFKTAEAMEALFQDLPEALDNTLVVVDRCNVSAEMVPLRQGPGGRPTAQFDHRDAETIGLWTLDVLFAPFLVVEFTRLEEDRAFADSTPPGLVSVFHRGRRRENPRDRPRY